MSPGVRFDTGGFCEFPDDFDGEHRQGELDKLTDELENGEVIYVPE